jgi:UDP-N-acetylglucosamine diphosphorylase/glucosamine-1-phosphate N-acetyltransferase
MKTVICLFEDEEYRNLLPLNYIRPSYDLRCGILTLREKIIARLPNRKFIFHCRKYLSDVLSERYLKTTVNNFDFANILFINGRILIDNYLINRFKRLKDNTALIDSNGVFAAVNLTSSEIKKLSAVSDEFLRFHKLPNLDKIEIQAKLINYPWDLINFNGEELIKDFELFSKKISKSDLLKFRSVEVKNINSIYIDKTAMIDPFVFLDASDGPIFIGNDARIMSHSSIQGPAFIGDNTIIKMHTSIYHNTSIGEVCKIGGEIENSIIHSHSNKQHEGFLGHSYISSWVNIGAGTNNSDLKNNYGNISVLLNGKAVDTKSQFVGLIMGDHSKTAINTMFNTGSVVGVSSNVFGSGFPPKYIPSFTWGGSDSLETYDFKKALDVAKLVINRRKMNLSDAETELFGKVFELTIPERT